MPEIVTGANVATLVSTKDGFSVQSGASYVETWEGPKAPIDAKRDYYATLGYDVAREQSGPLWKLTVQIPAAKGTDPTAEAPVDRYSVDTEFSQVDIRNAPKLLVKAGGSVGTIVQWLKVIDDFIKAGDPSKQDPDMPASAVTQDQQEAFVSLYIARARGQDSYEVRSCVMRRTRTLSASYPVKMKMNAVEIVYTTPKLISAFEIPANIVARLPDDPPEVEEATWGWRVTTQKADIILRQNKEEENLEWTFKAWSDLTYNLA